MSSDGDTYIGRDCPLCMMHLSIPGGFVSHTTTSSAELQPPNVRTGDAKTSSSLQLSPGKVASVPTIIRGKDRGELFTCSLLLSTIQWNNKISVLTEQQILTDESRHFHFTYIKTSKAGIYVRGSFRTTDLQSDICMCFLICYRQNQPGNLQPKT